MLEFFGSQSGEEIGGKSSLAFADSLAATTLTSWLMVSSSIFVYSAYCKGNIYDTSNTKDDIISCPEVNVIAIIKEGSKDINEQLKIICKLWYDDVRESKNGIASLSPFGDSFHSKEHDNNFRPYLINCQNQFPSLIPYGISLQDDLFANIILSENNVNKMSSHNANKAAFIHIQSFVSSTPRLHLKNQSVNVNHNNHMKRHPGVVACLGPSSNQRVTVSTPQSLIEQVLLQNYFGVNNFLVYDSNSISPQFMSAISNRQSELSKQRPATSDTAYYDSKLRLKIVPWNVPLLDGKLIVSGKNEFEVAQMDCYYRTVSKYSSDAFESSVYLEPGQILVPKKTKENVYMKSVPKLIHHLAATELSHGNKVSSKYHFEVRKFCSEYPSEEVDNTITTHAINALRKLTYNSKMSATLKKKSLSYHASNVEQSDKGMDVENSLAIIHDYGSCGDMIDDDDTVEKVDNTLEDLGHDIDEKIGKYFPSTIITSDQKQKLFGHVKKNKL